MAKASLHRSFGFKKDQKFKVGPDLLNLIELDNPIVNPPFNNWSVNQPSVTHNKGLNGKEDLGLRNLVIDGVNGFDFAQARVESKYINSHSKN